MQKTNKNYKFIKFEDLINKKNRKKTVKTIVDHLGLKKYDFKDLDKAFRKKINKTYSKKFPDYENWTLKQKNILSKHCSELMKIYGYNL